MADETKDTGGDSGGENTPVASGGRDHDRVAMLSLKVDGTPDQSEPEFIGDKDAALAATTTQFVEQAVSAKDVELRGAGTTDEVERKQSKDEKALADGHEKAEKEATAAAKKAVNALSK